MTDRVDTVEIFKGESGDWYWRRRNGYNNGIVAIAGEGYRHKGDCEDEARKINGDVTYVTLPQLTSIGGADDDGSPATD